MNFVLVPRLPRDFGMGAELAPAATRNYWNRHPHIARWTDRQIGLTRPCPAGPEIYELGAHGIKVADHFLRLLKFQTKWRQMVSWQQEVEAGLQDFELVSKMPWKEQQWYAFSVFRTLYDIHEIFHAVNIPSEDRLHTACHQAYEPFLQLAFLEYIDWL